MGIHRVIGIVLLLALFAGFFVFGASLIGVAMMIAVIAGCAVLITILRLIAWLLTYPPTQGTSHE